MSSAPDPVNEVGYWAYQTIIFTLGRRRQTNVPMEVSEQTMIRADATVKRLLEGVEEPRGTQPWVNAFTARVLDWVVENWRSTGPDNPDAS
jgi:hypothetical protein